MERRWGDGSEEGGLKSDHSAVRGFRSSRQTEPGVAKKEVPPIHGMKSDGGVAENTPPSAGDPSEPRL